VKGFCNQHFVRSSFFWDVAPRHWVIGVRRLQTA